MQRRTLLLVGGAAGTLLFGVQAAGRAIAASATIADLEAASGGRLGVALLDTHTGRRFAHRGDERFPMASTFKLLAAAQALARIEAGDERLDARVPIAAADLVAHSPVTERHVGARGLTVAELCEATITTSDNAAANLLLHRAGGPAGLTAFLRATGDDTTRLDRTEPTLNEALPGDPRDTTTPQAMLASLHRLLLGRVLSAASRERLTAWLVANKTGDERLRAGLPAGWRVGDKTGSGQRGSNNDVGIAWPSHPAGRGPLLMAVYLAETPLPHARTHATLAGVARWAATRWLPDASPVR